MAILADEMVVLVVKDLIPHRGAALMIDQIDNYDLDAKTLIASRLVGDCEWWCAGHFPGNPIMPGVLQLEAAAQAATCLAMLLGAKGAPLHTGDEDIRYREPVRPGDSITIRIDLKDRASRTDKEFWTFEFLVTNQAGKKCSSGIIKGVSDSTTPT